MSGYQQVARVTGRCHADFTINAPRRLSVLDAGEGLAFTFPDVLGGFPCLSDRFVTGYAQSTHWVQPDLPFLRSAADIQELTAGSNTHPTTGTEAQFLYMYPSNQW